MKTIILESTQIKVVNSITEDIKLATFDELIKQINDNLEQQWDRGTTFEKNGSFVFKK